MRVFLNFILVAFGLHCGRNSLNETTAPYKELGITETRSARSDADASEVCSTGLAAYENTVFPLIRDRCVNCHDRNDQRGPKFAVANSVSSYAAVLRYQNFDAIIDSFFVNKGGNMHCQSSYGQNCHTEKPEIIQALQAWWSTGESTCPRKGRVFSESLPLPSTLPDRSTGFQKMRWSLASQANPGMRNVFFEMEVQLFQPANDAFNGAYRFRKPRLLTPLSPVHLKDIKVLVNGTFDSQENAYRSIEQTIAAGPVPAEVTSVAAFPVLSSSHLLVRQRNPGADEIMVSFEALDSVTSPPVCRALDLFAQNVVPFLRSYNCHGCHGGGSSSLPGNQDAKALLDMAQPNERLCSAFLQRLSRAGLFNSPIVTYPFEGTFGHELSATNRAEMTATFAAWTQAEQF